MDKTYLSRLQLRNNLLTTQHHEVLACNAGAIRAVLELYVWLTSTYLPLRFPTIYTLTATHLHNTLTSSLLPLHLPVTLSSSVLALELLGANIDTEFFILLPSSDPADERKYRLEAFINCTPSGFNTRSKLNQLLAAIHGPVPGYAQKLEKSMDRFFAGLPVGRIVRRANWSVNTTGELYCLEGTHMHAEEAARRGIGEHGGDEEVDLGKAVLRCERQTLHRLPQSGALVFAFKVRGVHDVFQVEEGSCLLDVSVPDCGIAGRRQWRGHGRGDRWPEDGQCAGFCSIQASSGVGR